MSEIKRIDFSYTPSHAPEKPISVEAYTGLSARVMRLFNKAVIVVVQVEGKSIEMCINKRSLAKQILKAEGMQVSTITDGIKDLAYKTLFSDLTQMTNSSVGAFVKELNSIRERISEGIEEEIKKNPLEKIRSSILSKELLEAYIEQEVNTKLPLENGIKANLIPRAQYRHALLETIKKGDLFNLPESIFDIINQAVEQEIRARKKQIDQLVEAAAIQKFKMPPSSSS